MIPLSLEKLLSREQKEAVIKARLEATRSDLVGEIVSVTYDRRFGFDFEVIRGPGGKARVTFSLSIEDERFQEVLKDCADACHDVRFTSMSASAIRGGTHDAEEVENV